MKNQGDMRLHAWFEKAVGRDIDLRNQSVVFKYAEEWVLSGLWRVAMRQLARGLRDAQRIEERFQAVVDVAAESNHGTGLLST